MVTEGFKLLKIKDLPSDCNLFVIIDTLPTLLKADGIKKMGENMSSNANELEGIIKEFTDSTDKEGKLIVIGKIIRKITGITVQ